MARWPDVIERYCYYDDCPNYVKFGKRRYIGQTPIGMPSELQCKSCGKWCV